MNLVVAFAAGVLSTVVSMWRLVAAANARWHEAEDAEMSAKNRCDQLTDELDRNRWLL